MDTKRLATLRLLTHSFDKYGKRFRNYVAHGDVEGAQSEAFQLYQLIDEMVTFAEESE